MKQIKTRFGGGSLCAGLSVMTLGLLCLTGCQEDFGGYYDQPSWVSSTSKQVLQSRRDCKTYLKLVDKTLFSKQVEGSGQYTFLVPTDEAFDAFFANNPYGYKSVDDIPEEVASRMVSSWMMYNSYPCDTLSNVLSGFNTWEVNAAFKHQTPSYDVLREEMVDGQKTQVYEMRAGNFSLDNNAPIWNNYRFLPVYTTRFVNNNSISTDDWKRVVGTDFSPYGNYLQAGIIDAGTKSANAGDLYCQNGVIHLVDKVVMPLENLDAIIRTYGDGSAVDQPEISKEGAWKLLRQMLYHKKGDGDYLFLSYEEDAAAQHYYEKAYPEKDMSNFRLRRYRTSYSPFSLNLESYVTMQNLHTATDCFYTNYNGGMTFYVPEKSVFLKYINDRLFRYIGVEITDATTQEEFDAAFNRLSDNVVVALWASMQSDGMVWPSQFESMAVNSVGSSERINGYNENLTYDNGVVSAGMASNGMWQITGFMPKTAAFEGIGSRLLLDPAYSIEENLCLNNLSTSVYSSMLKSELSGMDDVDLTMILWGDANAKWWDNVHYSTLISAYSNYKGTGTEASSSVNSALLYNFRSGYVEREKVDALDLEVDPLNGAYGGWAYTNNFAGDVMRYRKSGRMIDGNPEIQIQTHLLLRHDENERALWQTGVPASLQTTEPTQGSYATVVKDNSADYVNGHVYLSTEHSAPLWYNPGAGTYGDGEVYDNQCLSNLAYLEAYLMADSYSDNPQHTIFYKYWQYYKANKALKANADTISMISTSNWTVFVPTDEALQYAIDYGKTTGSISILRDPAYLPTNPTENDANWVDSVIYFLNTYITKSGCYPDDGLSGLYETTEAWDGMKSVNRQAPTQYLATTNCKVTDVDRVKTTKVDGQDVSAVVKAWSGLISGGTMSGYVAKTGDGNKLQYFGRPYTSGAYQVVDVYNANEITDKFDNTIVREQGQSNIMGPSVIIHSLNGFIIYKIAGH